MSVTDGAPHRLPPSTPDRTLIDRVPVGAYSLDALVDDILHRVATPATDVFVGVNAHVVNLARRDARLRESLAVDSVTYADGASVVWASRFLGRAVPERVATTDLAPVLLAAAAARRHPVYFFGGRPGVAAAAAARMADGIPDLDVRTSHGYVGAHDVPRLLDDIRRHGTRILFVGLGDPLQQRWVADHRAVLPPVVVTCGGLFDWLSGGHRRAPQLLQDAGLEWAWRLALEPRRLAARYLVGNPAFVRAVIAQRLRRRAA